MPAINEINYDELAEMAATYHLSFAGLCERAEKGLPLSGLLIDETGTWATYQEAADILGCTKDNLGRLFTVHSMKLPYWGIEWKSRSLVNPNARRGCGVYFNVNDLKLLRRIRNKAKISWIAACKVHQAMVRGKI